MLAACVLAAAPKASKAPPVHDLASELSELAKLKSQGLLSDAAFADAAQGLVGGSHAQPTAPLSGANLERERYGAVGIPWTFAGGQQASDPLGRPAYAAAQAADAVAVEMEADGKKEAEKKEAEDKEGLPAKKVKGEKKKPNSSLQGAEPEPSEPKNSALPGQEAEEAAAAAASAPPSPVDTTKKIEISNKYQDNTEQNMVGADFVNIDYMSQGYNIFFGNALPTNAGVDPGYSDHAGESIWAFSYSKKRTTGMSDGAYNLPNGIYALHDVGCKLSYTASSSTTTKAYQDELSVSAKIEAGFDAGWVSGQASASYDYGKTQETNEERSTQTIISKAECVAYHTTLPDFEDRPEFTKGFKKAVYSAMSAPDDMKPLIFWSLFDTFGTHFPTMLKFGSRFGMMTKISSAASEKYGSESHAATLAMALNKEIEEEQEDCYPCSYQREQRKSLKKKVKTWKGKATGDIERDPPHEERGHGRTRGRSLERLTRAARSVDGSALRHALAKYERALEPEEAGSFLEVQAGPAPHRSKHAAARTARAKRAKRAEAALEADLEAAVQERVRTSRPHYTEVPPPFHSKDFWEQAAARRGVSGGDVRELLIARLAEKREAAAAAAAEAGELERLGGSFAMSASVGYSKSEAESFASDSSSMEMISLGPPPMGDIEEWAQQSNDFPMPISNELANICLLVASVASGKQVIAFATSEAEALSIVQSEKEEKPQTKAEKKAEAEAKAAEAVAPAAEKPAPSKALERSSAAPRRKLLSGEMTDAQQKMVATVSKLGVSTILSFDPLIDDPSGTVAACQAAFKSYCSDHLKLGDSCDGPIAKPTPAVYSACTKDDDCFVFSKSSTGGKMGYKMKCHSEKNICTPSYENLKEVKFMASGPTGGAPQTCETLSQGSGKKYFEIGDFNKKDRGDRTKNFKQEVVPVKPEKPNSKANAMHLKVKSYNKCADLANGKNFITHDCHGNTNQQFYFKTKPGKWVFQIKAVSSGKCLDYNFNNNDLYFHNCHSGANQEFYHADGNLDAPTYKNGAKQIKTTYCDEQWSGWWPFRRKISDCINKCIDYTGDDKFIMHECHGGDNQKFYWQANYFKQDMHVATRLCGLASNEEPDPPMCDIIQAGGESADAVNKALKINSVGEFGFTPIPTYFGGELVPAGAKGTSDPSFEQSYTQGHGMMFTQYAMDNRGGAASDGTCGGNCDKCLHSRLFTTAIGCNIPKAKPGEEMSCVKFVKTKLPNTPYGPIDESADVKCNDTVPSAYSGWCECATKDGKKVIHAVRSAVRNPIGKKYTCAAECKNPTWVPAIKGLEMAYTSEKMEGGTVIPHGKGAKCKPGYYDIEHLPVGSVGSSCVSLNSDLPWAKSGGVKAPPASKLCFKR